MDDADRRAVSCADLIAEMAEEAAARGELDRGNES